MPGTLLAAGTLAFDNVETPERRGEMILGGSATYFSCSAGLLSPVRLVSVVGEDFAASHVHFLQERGVDTLGVETRPGKTFFWHGKYVGDMGEAETVAVHLNVFDGYRPVVPESFRGSDYLFLANMSPRLQSAVLDQCASPKLAVCDTMNIWIEGERKALDALSERVHGVILNHHELAQWTGISDRVAAGRSLLRRGLRFVVVKKGEHGALLFTGDMVYPLPAYPIERVVDPTGAGDSFAGGFMGYLARTDDPTVRNLRLALCFGNVLASFVVEGFGTEGLAALSYEVVEKRLQGYLGLLRIDA